MSPLVLAVLLNSAPGIRLSDGPGARIVALAPTHSFLFGAGQPRAEGSGPNIDVSRRDPLAPGFARENAMRPGLLGPTLLLCAGVALGVAATVVGVYGGMKAVMEGLAYRLPVDRGVPVEVLLGSAVAMLTTGVALAIIGGILRSRALRARERYDVHHASGLAGGGGVLGQARAGARGEGGTPTHLFEGGFH